MERHFENNFPIRHRFEIALTFLRVLDCWLSFDDNGP